VFNRYHVNSAAGWVINDHNYCRPIRVHANPCWVVALQMECFRELADFMARHAEWRGLRVAGTFGDYSFPGRAGDTRSALPPVPDALLYSPQVAEWRVNNPDVVPDHRLTPLPIGISAYSGLQSPPTAVANRWVLERAAAAPPLRTRLPRVRADFMFVGYTKNRVERDAAAAALRDNPVVVVAGGRMEPHEFVVDTTRYQAIVCPPGNGIDTFRLWETLVLGALAIVKRSPNVAWLSRYAPQVVLVDDYDDITAAALERWVAAAEAAGTANQVAFEWLEPYWRLRLHERPLPGTPRVCPPEPGALWHALTHWALY